MKISRKLGRAWTDALDRVGAGIYVAAVLVFFFSSAAAQSVDNITPDQIQKYLSLPPDQLQQLLDQQRRTPQQVVPPAVTQQSSTLSPQTNIPPTVAKSSKLEELISKRAGTSLRQFGYDQLGSGGSVTANQLGAVQDSYILGPGDQLDITLRGQTNNEYTVTVDRDGRVIVPGLPPVSAGGRPFGEFRQDLLAAVHRAFISTQAYVTVAQLRQISVLVVGEVHNPGAQTLTGLSSVLDALNLAGGVKRSGSLRNVIIYRHGESIPVDLYSILLGRGSVKDLTIAEGDRIVVPSIGATVAITGDVRRPGIYELPAHSKAITQNELISLANGPTQRGVYRQTLQRIMPDGRERLDDVSGNPHELMHDSEILFMDRAVNFSTGRVTLSGSVRLPGRYSLDTAKTLHDLLPSIEAFAPTPYMLMGVIIRTDPHTLQRTILPFSPLHELQGTEDIPLISDDEVHVLTISEMRAMVAQQLNAEQNADWTSDSDLQGTNQFISVPGAPSAPSAGLPSTLPSAASTNGLTGQPPAISSSAPAALQATTADTSATNAAASPSVSIPAVAATDNEVSSFGNLSSEDAVFVGRAIADYRVTLTGAVRDPGVFLVSPGTRLDEIIAAANGLDSDADTNAFEITSTDISNSNGRSLTTRKILHVSPADFHTVELQPLDMIKFHHVYTNMAKGEVTISGEVRYPGTYTFMRGERLSEVLVRAGGLTNVAYPYGTVFLRQSIAQLEAAGHQRIADEAQRQIMMALARGNKEGQAIGTSPDALAATQAFILELKNQKALGRISIIADPSVLAAHPERDLILESGDRIYIPGRPNTVTVLGDVMQPGSFPFNYDDNAEDYVNLAGGYGIDALEDLTYVVYPDGTAERVEHSWLHFNSHNIPPGSVIFVPRDLFPTDWLSLTTSIADVIKDLAISAASVAVLAKNN